MCNVFVLFSEEVAYVTGSGNMMEEDIGFMYLFSNSVFPNLNMTEAFGGEVVGPGHTCCIIIVNGCRGRHEFFV